MANDDDFLLVSFSVCLTARNYSLKRARQLPRLKTRIINLQCIHFLYLQTFVLANAVHGTTSVGAIPAAGSLTCKL